MSTPPTVLFICQHNAGRSQLGAHLLAHVAPGQVKATSGGFSPAEHINPVIVGALGRLGIDTSAAAPRAVTPEDLASADVVVTMKPRLSLPDPVTRRLVQSRIQSDNAVLNRADAANGGRARIPAPQRHRRPSVGGYSPV